MKKSSIKLSGKKYGTYLISAYSERAGAIRYFKLRHKVETTVKAVSILLASGITVMTALAMV